jgi:hypothetical protein
VSELTMTWGTYSLPLPDEEGIHVLETPIGSVRQMLNGYMRGQVISRGTNIRVVWPKLTDTERALMRTAWDANYDAAELLTLPDGRSWTVITGINPWDETEWYAAAKGEWRYDVTLTFISSVPG